MYVQKLFNLEISANTVRCMHPTLQKDIDYV